MICPGMAVWKALLLGIQALWLEMETIVHLSFQGLPEQGPMGIDGVPRNCRESPLAPLRASPSRRLFLGKCPFLSELLL